MQIQRSKLSIQIGMGQHSLYSRTELLNSLHIFSALHTILTVPILEVEWTENIE